MGNAQVIRAYGVGYCVQRSVNLEAIMRGEKWWEAGYHTMGERNTEHGNIHTCRHARIHTDRQTIHMYIQTIYRLYTDYIHTNKTYMHACDEHIHAYDADIHAHLDADLTHAHTYVPSHRATSRHTYLATCMHACLPTSTCLHKHIREYLHSSKIEYTYRPTYLGMHALTCMRTWMPT